MNRIRSFMIWSDKKGIISRNPFDEYGIDDAVYGKPIYITVEERNILYNTDLSDDSVLAQQRDIFVFQSLIGCRVGDLYRFTQGNIIDGGLEYIPGNTNNERASVVRVPLTKTAQEILERYRYPDRKAILPFISEQQYNIHIKQAFKRAGLTRMVTVVDQVTREAKQEPLCDVASTHMARRTFIGNIYKKIKDPNIIGSMSGHKEGSRAFARYRDIDEDIKREVVNLLE
jgi:integrase